MLSLPEPVIVVIYVCVCMSVRKWDNEVHNDVLKFSWMMHLHIVDVEIPIFTQSKPHN